MRDSTRSHAPISNLGWWFCTFVRYRTIRGCDPRRRRMRCRFRRRQSTALRCKENIISRGSASGFFFGRYVGKLDKVKQISSEVSASGSRWPERRGDSLGRILIFAGAESRISFFALLPASGLENFWEKERPVRFEFIANICSYSVM